LTNLTNFFHHQMFPVRMNLKVLGDNRTKREKKIVMRQW
jgi:hypothetical protein